MGTRGNVVVQDDGKTLVRIYRQFDTYLTGMGQDLVEFFGKEPQIVNGFGSRDVTQTFNGMGCLAASLIAHLKEGIGNVYIQNVDDEPDGLFIEYVYTLYESERQEAEDGFRGKPGRLYIKVEGLGDKSTPETVERADGTTYESSRYNYEVIYDGPFADFDPLKIEEERSKAASKLNQKASAFVGGT